jgi:putative hydrolase of the HAD superfamily
VEDWPLPGKDAHNTIMNKCVNGIRAIGFDLFNTLITVEPLALDHAVGVLSHRLQAEGIPAEPESFHKAHRQAALHHITQARHHGRETHNRFWISGALRQLGYEIEPDDPRIGRAIEVYFSAFLEFCRLIPGTEAMLGALKARYPLGLLSNFTHPPAARAILDALGIASFFDVVLISGEVGYCKPHASVFQLFLEELGVKPGELLYVGDDPGPDIDGACSMGIRPVWTTYVRDRGIPLAPGVATDQRGSPQCEAPRISSWDDLLVLLGFQWERQPLQHLSNPSTIH